MSDFSNIGGVGILGFISPLNTGDTYPVIDPLYGIDGLRNVPTVSDMYDIPELRRRAGMIVSVSGGSVYYKLNPEPWNFDSSDWSIFNSGGGGSSITGGTYTSGSLTLNDSDGGSVVINGFYTGFTGGVVSGLTATTLSASTYMGLPMDVFVTGGTYSNGAAIFGNNTGGTFSITGFYTGGTDVYTTGATLSGQTLLFYRNDGVTYSVSLSSLISGGGQPITSFTYNNNTFYIGLSGTTPYTANISDVTGLTSSGLVRSQSISATTYQNLPTDIRVTGGTYSNGITTFTNNTGGTFSVSGYSTNTGDTYVTGATFSSNTLTIYQNQGQTPITAQMSTTELSGIMSSITFNISSSGGITASTFSATTYQNLPTDIRVTGGTYSNGNVTFTNNTGGTFSVNGFFTGSTDIYVTGITYQNNNIVLHRNGGLGDLSANIDAFSSLTVTGLVNFLGYSGSTDRMLQVNSGGTVTAYTEIISAYLVSTGATATILDTPSNWSPSGQYTGTSITDTYQGQKHYNSSYLYEAVADNVWIRLLRG